MRHAYYIEKEDGGTELLGIDREPMSFKDAMRFAIANEAKVVFSRYALYTQVEADKVRSNQLFELDGTHDLLQDVTFVKDDYNSGNYMVFRHEYSAVWRIPGYIKTLFQKGKILDAKVFKDGVSITATCKNGKIKTFDFTREQQWYNWQFEQQVCENFEEYNNIHIWIMEIL